MKMNAGRSGDRLIDEDNAQTDEHRVLLLQGTLDDLLQRYLSLLDDYQRIRQDLSDHFSRVLHMIFADYSS